MSELIDTSTRSETGIVENEAATNSLIEQLQEQLKLQQEELFQQQRELFLHESTTPTTTTWGFTHGLIVGQFSVLFVIIVFVKFFVFAESSPSSKQSIRDASGVIVKRDKQKKKSQDLASASAEDSSTDERLLSNKAKVAAILEKTYYDVDNHAPETLDWFNVLVAQTISQLRSEALLADNIYHSLNDFLENSQMPDFLGKINLTEIDIGDDFPIFSNCRIKHSQGRGRLEAKIDVDLSDTLTLGIDTKLLLNHPRPLTAVLPVELTVSIVRFSGCLTVSLINTNDPEFVDLASHQSTFNQTTKNGSGESTNGTTNTNKEGAGTALMFSFSPDYRLEFIVKSLIGSRAKLQDVPKISELIESKLRTWFIDRCVEPRFQVVRLPSLWPRSKNTREPIKTKVVDDENGRKKNKTL
ncbi:Maintenance of mitochondrial morphology protein 1 [Spathaspora sp. JA1]|nr:Maintenance of mitochondrial morphology protein 1 [Spathaspora sp. JA1]